MRSRLFMIVGFCLAAAVAAAGCGSDEGSSSLTRAEFIKQADAICEKADEAQGLGLNKASEEKSVFDRNKAEKRELIVTVGLKPIERESEELAELPPPEGDEQQIEEILDELDAALARAEQNPDLISDGVGASPFAAANELATEYGFKACNELL